MLEGVLAAEGELYQQSYLPTGQARCALWCTSAKSVREATNCFVSRFEAHSTGRNTQEAWSKVHSWVIGLSKESVAVVLLNGYGVPVRLSSTMCMPIDQCCCQLGQGHFFLKL